MWTGPSCSSCMYLFPCYPLLPIPSFLYSLPPPSVPPSKIHKTDQNQPISVTLNTTNPGGIVDSSNTQFFVAIKRIAETRGNSEIRSVAIATVGFAKADTMSGRNKISNYTATLENGAFISIIVSFVFHLFNFFYFYLLSYTIYFVLLDILLFDGIQGNPIRGAFNVLSIRWDQLHLPDALSQVHHHHPSVAFPFPL